MNKIWYDLEEMLEKEVSKIVTKNDIAPPEIDPLKDISFICLNICKMKKIESEMYNMNNSDRRFSMDYEDSKMHGRGRDGRFVSMTGDMSNDIMWRDMADMNHVNRGNSYGNEPYRDEHSNHSIKDRVIANMENMMDTTNSDYERQELQKYIQKMRTGM